MSTPGPPRPIGRVPSRPPQQQDENLGSWVVSCLCDDMHDSELCLESASPTMGQALRDLQTWQCHERKGAKILRKS